MQIGQPTADGSDLRTVVWEKELGLFSRCHALGEHVSGGTLSRLACAPELCTCRC